MTKHSILYVELHIYGGGKYFHLYKTELSVERGRKRFKNFWKVWNNYGSRKVTAGKYNVSAQCCISFKLTVIVSRGTSELESSDRSVV